MKSTDEFDGSEAGGRGARKGTETGVLSRNVIFEGRIVGLSLDTVRFPDGSVGELEMIRHSGAAAVLPVQGSLTDPDPTLLLLRQYRPACGGTLLEIPAGRPDFEGEPWDRCARRELEEETGCRAGELRFLTHIYTTPGFTDEVIHLYLAEHLEPGQAERDRDEFIEVLKVPLSEAVRWISDGKIIDAKSIAAILYAERLLRG